MCPYGTVGEILDKGINQEEKDATNCATNTGNESCTPNSQAFTDSMTAAISQENYIYEFPTQDLWKTNAEKNTCFIEGKSRLFI